MPTTSIIDFSSQKLEPHLNPGHARTQSVKLPVGTHDKGTVLGEVTSQTAADEVQTIDIGGATGGSYRLVFNGQITAAIADDAAAGDIEDALEALSNLGAGNVTVAANGADFDVTFTGDAGNVDQPLMTVIDSTTGGTGVVITVDTEGNPGGGGFFKPYDDSASDGTEVARGILQYDVVVDTFGNHQVGGGEHGEAQQSAPAYYVGTFKTADLTGLDANGLADLGRLISGSVSDGVLRIG